MDEAHWPSLWEEIGCQTLNVNLVKQRSKNRKEKELRGNEKREREQQLLQDRQSHWGGILTSLWKPDCKRKHCESHLLDLQQSWLFSGSKHWKDWRCAKQTLLFTGLYTWVIIYILPTQNSLHLPHLGTEARFVQVSSLNKVFCWYICYPLRNSCFSFFCWHMSNRSRGTTWFLTLKASNAQFPSSVHEKAAAGDC